MRKLTLTIAIASIAFVYAGAQKKLVKEANNALENGELDKAWTAIETAKDNEESKVMGKTWFVRGKILQAIGTSTDAKYTGLHDNPLVEAYNSYLKAGELEKSYAKDVDMQMLTFTNYTVNKGVEYFKAENFAKSLEMFELTLKIEERPMYKGSIDTGIMYNAGLAASNAKQWDKAIQLFQKPYELKYAGSSSAVMLKNAYFGKGDTTSGMNIIKTAFEANPGDMTLIIELINYYITKNQVPEALTFLNKAKEKDPNNVSFYFAEGTMYEKINEFDKAFEAYKKAVEIDPTYFNGYYNLGVFFYNRAVKLYDEASKQTDDAKYNDLKNKGDEALKSALPYMEKAHELDVKEDEATRKTVMESLKGMYFRLQMTDKLNAIKKELGQ